MTSSAASAAAGVGFDSHTYYPVLTEFAKSCSATRKLSGLVELSFVAGRAFDEDLYWRADTEAALTEAFPRLTGHRRAMIFAALEDAYNAGIEQFVIDASSVSPTVTRLARMLSASEAESVSDPEKIDAVAARIAFLISRDLGVQPALAARAAIDVLTEVGARTSLMAGERVMDAARAGWRRATPPSERWPAND